MSNKASENNGALEEVRGVEQKREKKNEAYFRVVVVEKKNMKKIVRS